MNGNKESWLIFEIAGVPRKKNLLKKHRSYVAAYNDHIFIELDGENDLIPIENIFNVYIKEPIIDNITSRTTVIEYFDEGEDNWYELEDETFEGLSAKMEKLLSNEWIRFKKSKQLPDYVRWFNACCALVFISSEQDPDLFGGAVKTPESASAHRKELYESWGFENPGAFQEMLPLLLEGRAVEQYKNAILNIDSVDEDSRKLLLEIKNSCGDKGIWAWDLCRLILLCELGYLCDYAGYEEAIEWCRKAGKKLQSIYVSWDDMIRSYLLGYCFWSGEDLNDEDTEAHLRLNIYKAVRNTPGGPYSIDWNLSLD